MNRDERPIDRCGDPRCDHSHVKSWAEIDEKMMNTILEHGHQVIEVFGEVAEDFLGYSVGRCVIDNKPEFVTTGPLPQTVPCFMINEASKLMDEGTPVADGYEFPRDTLIANYPVRVVAVDPDAYPLNSIWNLFGHDPDITVLQLVWPDMSGHFPDDPDYAGPAQPLHPLKETAMTSILTGYDRIHVRTRTDGKFMWEYLAAGNNATLATDGNQGYENENDRRLAAFRVCGVKRAAFAAVLGQDGRLSKLDGDYYEFASDPRELSDGSWIYPVRLPQEPA